MLRHEILYIALSYLVGAIPFGLILYWLFEKKDIREKGSGNIGAVNVFRVGGSLAGFLTLFLDVMKGAFPILYGLKHFDSPVMIISGGAVAILGHMFSVYLKFRGGKGIATFLGLILVFHFPSACGFGIVFILTVCLTRYASAGSIAGAITVFFMIMFTHVVEVSIVFFAIVLLMIIKHQSNIKRLLVGTELKWSWKQNEQN